MINCPDCEAPLDVRERELSSDEAVTEMDCTNCPFSIETMSNQAWRDYLEGV